MLHMKRVLPLDLDLLAAHLPERGWPGGGAYPRPAYSLPRNLEIVKRNHEWALNWTDEEGGPCGNADHLMSELAGLIPADEDSFLSFAKSYGVPTICFEHGAVGSGHDTICKPWKPLPIEPFRQRALAFVSIWSLFAQYRRLPARQAKVKGDYWTGARGFTPSQAKLVSRILRESGGEDLPFGRLQRLIQQKTSRADLVLRAYMRSRLHQYGFSFTVGAGDLSNPQALRPAPVMPNVMAAAYFKLLLTVTNTARSKVCDICRSPFEPRNTRRLYCYSVDCEREMKNRRQRERRSGRTR